MQHVASCNAHRQEFMEYSFIEGIDFAGIVYAAGWIGKASDSAKGLRMKFYRVVSREAADPEKCSENDAEARVGRYATKLRLPFATLKSERRGP